MLALLTPPGMLARWLLLLAAVLGISSVCSELSKFGRKSTGVKVTEHQSGVKSLHDKTLLYFPPPLFDE